MFRFFRVRHHVFITLVFASIVVPLFSKAVPFDPLPASDGKWRHFQSPNFELYSRDGAQQSRELLHRLELLRTVFFDTFKLQERHRLDVTIFLFNRDKDFRAYLPASLGERSTFEAYHAAYPDRAFIVLGPVDDRLAAQHTIFHEYIHHLYRVSGEDPPLWMNEGMAELFATLVVKSDVLEFGRPNPGRLYQLREENMMPFEQLFAVDHRSSVFQTDTHTGLFYAQSWALLHYWHFGQSGLPASSVDRFLLEVRSDPPPSPAKLSRRFQEIFGMDYRAMEKRLAVYSSGGRYVWRRAPMPKVAAPASYAVRPVPIEEARLRMAELALRVNGIPQAKLVLLDAVQRSPGDFRSLEALGAAALIGGDEQSARERWQQALDAGSPNPAIYRELSRIETRAWFPQSDIYFRLPEEKAGRLRDLLSKSINYSPDQTEAYEMLAWVEAFAPTPNIRNVNLAQSHYARLKNQELALLAFALVRHRLSDNPGAMELLASLEEMAPNEQIRDTIESLRAKIEDRPLKRSQNRLPQQLTPEKIFRIELPGKP